MSDQELLHWIDTIGAQLVDVLGKRRRDHTDAVWWRLGEVAMDMSRARFELQRIMELRGGTNVG